jgi:5-bromo-4-chloroindolyl phosphate hydrolysis protein
MFRAVNEEMRALNEGFAGITDTYSIVCECEDMGCVETLEIERRDYFAIRGNPRRFVVARGHVSADIERVVSESEGYAVVEKIGSAGVVAEAMEPAQD